MRSRLAKRAQARHPNSCETRARGTRSARRLAILRAVGSGGGCARCDRRPGQLAREVVGVEADEFEPGERRGRTPDRSASDRRAGVSGRSTGGAVGGIVGSRVGGPGAERRGRVFETGGGMRRGPARGLSVSRDQQLAQHRRQCECHADSSSDSVEGVARAREEHGAGHARVSNARVLSSQPDGKRRGLAPHIAHRRISRGISVQSSAPSLRTPRPSPASPEVPRARVRRRNRSAPGKPTRSERRRSPGRDAMRHGKLQHWRKIPSPPREIGRRSNRCLPIR